MPAKKRSTQAKSEKTKRSTSAKVEASRSDVIAEPEETLYVSEAQLERMKEELREAKEKLKDIREQKRLAMQDGGTMSVENHSATLDNLMREENSMMRRIEDIENDIRRAEVKSNSTASDIICIGDLVTYKADYNDGEGALVQTFKLLSTLTGHDKEDDTPAISTKCAVGASLLGRKVGETITVNLAQDNTVDIIIISKCSEAEQAVKE